MTYLKMKTSKNGNKTISSFLINLDLTSGSEIQKTRPCVIVSPNEINDHLKAVVITSMTSTSRNYPTRVKVKHDNQEGWVVINQIRTIEKFVL